MVAADTGFLFSLYGQDANTPKAKKQMRLAGVPVALSPFNEFELTNAVRFSVFRGTISSDVGAAMLADFEADQTGGRVVPAICNLADVLAEAMRLSASHTIAGGHRAFDILHVAAAFVMKVKKFYSFDENQRKLAHGVGLQTN